MTARCPRWLRWLKRLFVLAVALAAVLAVTVAGVWWRGHRDLQALLAATAATDPRWTLAEIVADRPAVPDDQNGAALVLAVAAQIARVSNPAEDAFNDLRPGDRLNAAQQAYLRTLFAPELAGRRDTAHALADRPRGRFAVPWADDPVAAMNAVLNGDVSTVERFLRFSVYDLADRGDRDAAVRAWRAAWNATRTLADEPTVIACLVRVGRRSSACGQVRWLLARRPWTDYQLAAIQAELTADEPADLIGPALRSERAYLDALLVRASHDPAARAYFAPSPRGRPTWRDRVDQASGHLPGYLDGQRRDLHRVSLRLLDIAKRPDPERSAAFHDIVAEAAARRGVERDIMPGVAKTQFAVRRDTTMLRCTIAAVACERYRVRTGRFPDSLDEVVAAGLLPAVPRDPFAAGPMRLAKRGGGIVIYSVGSDGRDDGGRVDPEGWFYGDGYDWGLTLLPLAERGRLPSLPWPTIVEEKP